MIFPNVFCGLTKSTKKNAKLPQAVASGVMTNGRIHQFCPQAGSGVLTVKTKDEIIPSPMRYPRIRQMVSFFWLIGVVVIGFVSVMMNEYLKYFEVQSK